MLRHKDGYRVEFNKGGAVVYLSYNSTLYAHRITGTIGDLGALLSLKPATFAIMAKAVRESL